jgi:uncharacterized RDD family membrane protein YckC
VNPESTNTLRLRTPEGITFALPLAGPVTRLLASLVDFVLVLVVTSLLSIAVAALGWLAPDLARALATVSFFALQLGYPMATEWLWRGQTIGKRLLHLRVVDVQGLKLHFNQIAIRNLLRAVDILPGLYLVGGLAVLLSRRAQRLGDFAANTVVIRIPRLTQPDLEQLLAGKFNSLRTHPHLCARLRQQVSPDEAALALSALLRRDELDPVARVELFRELVGQLRARVEFPPEDIESLADEQYLRNVVDVLYRPKADTAGAR